MGSAIGMKVLEDVPYVVGMDEWLGDTLTDDAKAYLKDFGAATASNGSVGLYHIDNLTPEAKDGGEALLSENYKEYIIDDAELERVYRSSHTFHLHSLMSGQINFVPIQWHAIIRAMIYSMFWLERKCDNGKRISWTRIDCREL